jgi:hypothetical protein
MSVRSPQEQSGATASPTVAVLCPKVWGIRNIVHSGMAEQLSRRGIRVALLVPPGSLSDGGLHVGAAVTLHPLLEPALIRSQRGVPLLNAVLHGAHARRFDLNYRGILHRWERERSGRALNARDVAVEAFSMVVAWGPLLRRLVQFREWLFNHDRDLSPVVEQLQHLRTDLIVSTNCQFSEERPYVVAARALGIPTLGCIQSFDNLTTRSILPVFDHYAVWNGRMRDQVLAFYPDRDPAEVHVTGTPQFDFHRRPECRWPRERLLAQLGLAPEERYIVYAPGALPSDPDVLPQLDRAMRAMSQLSRHRIVVRPHPADRPERWADVIAAIPRCVLSWPWRVKPGVPWDAPELIEPVDQARLVSTLVHADACLNAASTITLDAAILDAPVVCIGFAPDRGSADDRLRAQCYHSTHYAPITESGGVRLARSMDQLVEEIAAYVQEPALDREERHRLVAEECGPVDGRAGVRIADLISRLVAVDMEPTPLARPVERQPIPVTR